MPDAPDKVRLDKWLWAARFYKTRAIAAAAVAGGKVQVNGERVKRAKLVQIGDTIRIREGPYEHLVTVRALSERRGPAKVAATLYEEDPETARARQERARQIRAMPTAFYEGKGRPTKKQRRTIDRFKRGLALLVWLGASTPLAAQVPESAVLPIDTQVVTDTLDNGLRYIIRENHRPEHRAELRLVVRAGSVLEDDDQRGLAHFVEHMAFNGTANFARQDLVNYLELVGMRFGPDLNAYTGFDETVYMLEVPTDSPAVFRTAFQILEDWATAVVFDSAEIEKERGVVIEEWRLGRGAESRIRDQQLPVVFHDSRYAERLPIGDPALLSQFEHDALRRFYRDWYRPDLMAVVAVGDFDRERVEALIHDHFGHLPRAEDPRERPQFPEPDHAEPLFAIVTDPEATGSSVSVLFKQDMQDPRTYGAYRRWIVESLFTAMLNARLFELTQQEDPAFLGAGSGKGRFVGAKEVFSLGASVRAGGIERGLEALLTEAERVSRHGFTRTELERHKIRRLRYVEQAYAEREKTHSSRYAAEYIRHFLHDEPIPGIAFELELHRRYLPGIGLDEVNHLAREWLTPHNRVVLVSAPESADGDVPTEGVLEAVFARVQQEPVAAYVDSTSDAPLVPEPPWSGAVVAEREIPEIGVIVWELANGVSVVLKPTDFRDDEILLQGTSPGGYSLATDSHFVSAFFSDVVVAQTGVGAFNAIELEKALAGKAVRIRPSIGDVEEGIAGSASPRDVETLFQLVYLYFVAPREDTTAFRAFRQQYLSFATDRQASPEAAFSDTVQVTLSQHHPRRPPFTPQLIREIDLADALWFYRDRFADASDFTFFLVGNLDPDSIRPLVETYLGGLPTLEREETWRDLEIEPPAGVVERAVYRGMEPKSRTQITFTGPFTDSRTARHALRSMTEALDLRLREVLREDLGGTYSVSVRGMSTIAPDTSYTIHITFGAAPQRLEDLTDVVFAEIARLQREGPTDSVVRKVRETQRREYEVNMRQNGFWLGQLVASHRYGVDPRGILTYGELIDALTADVIQDAARRYLNTDRYVRISLYPERGANP